MGPGPTWAGPNRTWSQIGPGPRWDWPNGPGPKMDPATWAMDPTWPWSQMGPGPQSGSSPNGPGPGPKQVFGPKRARTKTGPRPNRRSGPKGSGQRALGALFGPGPGSFPRRIVLVVFIWRCNMCRSVWAFTFICLMCLLLSLGCWFCGLRSCWVSGLLTCFGFACLIRLLFLCSCVGMLVLLGSSVFVYLLTFCCFVCFYIGFLFGLPSMVFVCLFACFPA